MFNKISSNNAALPYTEYPLRMLKFEICAEIMVPNIKLMRMYRAGLVQNDVFAKALRMLADPYKCLKNVAIDCHPHYRYLDNAL